MIILKITMTHKKSNQKEKQEPEPKEPKEPKEPEQTTEQATESDVFNFCNWVSYKGTRCTAKIGSHSKLCTRHKLLKNDFLLVTDDMISDEISLMEKDPDYEAKFICLTEKEIKFVPRSKTHIVNVLDNLGYKYKSEEVEIYTSTDIVENADFSNENYIKILQADGLGTEFYYKPERGQGKIKDIKVRIIKSCTNKASILVRDEDCYCRECYVKVAKRLGYPTYKSLSF